MCRTPICSTYTSTIDDIVLDKFKQGLMVPNRSLNVQHKVTTFSQCQNQTVHVCEREASACVCVCTRARTELGEKVRDNCARLHVPEAAKSLPPSPAHA